MLTCCAHSNERVDTFVRMIAKCRYSWLQQFITCCICCCCCCRAIDVARRTLLLRAQWWKPQRTFGECCGNITAPLLSWWQKSMKWAWYVLAIYIRLKQWIILVGYLFLSHVTRLITSCSVCITVILSVNQRRSPRGLSSTSKTKVSGLGLKRPWPWLWPQPRAALALPL